MRFRHAKSESLFPLFDEVQYGKKGAREDLEAKMAQAMAQKIEERAKRAEEWDRLGATKD